MNTVLAILLGVAMAAVGSSVQAREFVQCGWKTDVRGHEYHSCWFVT